MAGDRGSRATSQALSQNFQYAIPLTAQTKRVALQKFSLTKPTATDTIWQDNLESGTNGWTFQSAYDLQIYWHRNTREAFGGTGFSYWCADSTLNGYGADWFQLLETPEIDLTGTTAPTLIFKHNYSVENPAGASQYRPELDGWDGIAVRISTDGGKTFTPLIPAGGYPQRSLYGFFRIYGFNAPGWTGKSAGWVDANFNLSNYRGQKVIIRFEFGSDPGCSTADPDNCSPSDAGTLRGWRVDNLQVTDGTTTLFSDDGGDTGPATLTSKILPQIFWHTVTTRANSPTHSWWCGDDVAGRYPNYIFNYLISPKIFVPLTGQNNAAWFRIFLDFRHFYNMELTSNNKFDFFAVEVSNDGGKTWANPTGFVYVGNSNNLWIPFEGSYSSPINLTNMAGDTVQIRWLFISDDSINNIGFFLDDPMIVGVSGLPNDVSTVDLDVPFPNITNQPIRTLVEVANVGINDQATVPLFRQINNDPPRPIPPLFSVPSGGSVLRDFEWIPPAPGGYHITVFTNLPLDEARSNDTLSTRTLFDTPTPIQVTPQGRAVLGYHDRFGLIRDNLIRIVTVNWIVHFTPRSDVAQLASYNLETVAIAFFNNQTQSDAIRVIIGTAATPTTIGTTIYDAIETIPGSADPVFRQIDLRTIAAAQGLQDSFLVKIDFAGSQGRAGILVDYGTRFTGHNYFLPSGSQTFQPVNVGANIVASISYLTTAVETPVAKNLPTQFNLHANYPNPIRSAEAHTDKNATGSVTRISFDLPKASHVKITIYDITGRLIATILNARRPAGRHEVQWNASGLPAGAYFYKMQAEQFEAVRKMLIL
jgi:hypothetical protein